MNRGYTVTPVVSEDDSGNQEISDFNISSPNLTDHNGQPQGFEDDFVQDENGEWQYQMPDDPDQYERVETDADQAYIDNIFDAYPGLPAALEAAANHIPEDVIHQYNNALEVGDWDLVMPFIEQVMEDYYNGVFGDTDSEGEDEEYEPDVEDDEEPDFLAEWEEEELQVVEQEIEPLLMNEADESLVEHWQEQVESSDDPVYQGVCAATAAFHAGEATAEEAINYVLANYPKADVIRVYSMIHG